MMVTLLVVSYLAMGYATLFFVKKGDPRLPEDAYPLAVLLWPFVLTIGIILVIHHLLARLGIWLVGR